MSTFSQQRSRPLSDSDDEIEITLVPNTAATGAHMTAVNTVGPRQQPTGKGSPKSWCFAVIVAAVAVLCLVLLLKAVENSDKTAVLLSSDADADATAAAFRSFTTTDGARESLRYYSNGSHVAGRPRDLETAEYTRDKFLELGLPMARLESYDVLLNYPVAGAALLQIVSPPAAAFNASLKEAELAEDPMSSRPHYGPFNGYAPSGDVTAKYVYANYGRVEDYDVLATRGINVSGLIVLCRYGRIFRGNKVDNAESRGAVGVVIFSDPADDGAGRGTPYPNGPWRSGSSLQRGSVFLGEGDPLTPSFPSTNGTLRLTLDEARDPDSVGMGWALPSIPSLPISADDARPIMQALDGGAGVPDDWVGGLGVTYSTGPGTAELRLKTQNEFKVTTIWNAIATIPGAVEPDRWVLVGNHRDAWVAGAIDPSSGSSALLEMARGFGELLKTGWQPDRTIMLCSWDAEEYGLVGSTEWVEQHYRSLQNKAVAYLNLDMAVGSQGVAELYATPSLTEVIYRAARQVPQPECVPTIASLCDNAQSQPGDSVYDFWLREDELPQSDPKVPNLRLLGSGSDHTAFIAHSGIAAMDASFSGGYYGVYHSLYDSFHWVSTYGDPEFRFHKAAADLVGTIAVILANDAVLPLDFTDYAEALERYEQSLRDHLTSIGGSDGTPAGGIEAGTSEEFGLPVPDAPAAQTLDLSRLAAATAQFKQAAVNAKQDADELAQQATSGKETDPTFLFKVRALNDRLQYTERCFINDEGLPGRQWYKHVIFTPSLHDSYGSTAFPAVNDALVVGNWREAQRQLDTIVHLLDRATETLRGDILV